MERREEGKEREADGEEARQNHAAESMLNQPRLDSAHTLAEDGDQAGEPREGYGDLGDG